VADVDASYVTFFPLMWRLVGGVHEDTSIDPLTGVLEVSPSETAESFQVEAYLEVPGGATGRATVIIGTPQAFQIVADVEINIDGEIMAHQNTDNPLRVMVLGTGRVDQTLEWEAPERVNFAYHIVNNELYDTWSKPPSDWPLPKPEDWPDDADSPTWEDTRWSYPEVCVVCSRFPSEHDPDAEIVVCGGETVLLWPSDMPIIFPDTEVLLLDDGWVFRVNEEEGFGFVRLRATSPVHQDIPALEMEILIQPEEVTDPGDPTPPPSSHPGA
jgi:hypothetical protein